MYEALDAQRIRMHMSSVAQEFCRRIDVHASIESTNAWLLQRVREGAANAGDVCMAETQSAGRGRRGRRWESPASGGLYLSVAWQVLRTGLDPGPVTLALGAAALDALHGFPVGGRLGLKWPNDLYADGRKLGGMLVEHARGKEDDFWVVGLGLNLCAERLPQVGDPPPAGLDELWPDAGAHRNRLAAALIDHVLQACLRYEQRGFGDMRERWCAYDLTRDRPIEVLAADGRRLRGVGAGIDRRGRLRVVCDGAEYHLDAGEVSLRIR